MNVIYAAVVAGGAGSRMGKTELPKQFLSLQNKPIVIYSIEKFLLCGDINKILVLVAAEYIEHTQKIVDQYIGDAARVVVVEGGTTRNETIMNGIRFIQNNFGIQEDDICLTHDAARPFITSAIIEENIAMALEFGAVTTAIKAIDTILVSRDAQSVSEVPIRDNMYQCQTPQTFSINLLLECYSKLTAAQKANLTDATKILILQGKSVKIAAGEAFNIKITTQHDLTLANSILKNLT